MHGYVVCINLLVLAMLSNVYTSTPHLRAFPILIPNLYQQHHSRPTEKFSFTLIILSLTLPHGVARYRRSQGLIYAPVWNYSRISAGTVLERPLLLYFGQVPIGKSRRGNKLSNVAKTAICGQRA